jgi:exonuclease III
MTDRSRGLNLRIISLNGHGRTLGAAVADCLKATDPDLLCLQDVVHTPDARKEWPEYRDGAQTLAQYANVLTEVAAGSPNQVATICPAAQVDVWEGSATTPSWWGLATFTRRSLPQSDHGFTHTRTSHSAKSGRFAQDMLVKPQAQVTRFGVVQSPEVSDHCPLLPEIG